MSDDLNPSTSEPTVTRDRFGAEPQKSAGFVEREGLPPTYRMRADRHYVDQLAIAAGSHPVREIPVADIDDAAAIAHGDDVRPLIESIRTMGIVQPLIVRRQQSRYAIVSGRKRLAAARTLRLATVPCLVRDVSDAEASAIAAADNLRAAGASSPEPETDSTAALDELELHLAAIERCADLSLGGHISGLDRTALNLLRAHAWRAECLLGALQLIAGTQRRAHVDPLGAAELEDVIAGFRPELTSAGASIRAEITDPLPRGFDTSELKATVRSALLAMLPLIRTSDRPTLIVKVGATSSNLSVQVQIDAAVSRAVAAHFFDGDVSARRSGDAAAAIGALAVKRFAERHGGRIAFEPLDDGSRLTIVLSRAV